MSTNIYSSIKQENNIFIRGPRLAIILWLPASPSRLSRPYRPSRPSRPSQQPLPTMLIKSRPSQQSQPPSQPSGPSLPSWSDYDLWRRSMRHWSMTVKQDTVRLWCWSGLRDSDPWRWFHPEDSDMDFTQRKVEKGWEKLRQLRKNWEDVWNSEENIK